MRVPRIQVTTALFELCNGLYPWITSGPRLQVPDNLPPEAQPAMFLVKPRETWDQNERMSLTRYKLKYYALVMLRADSTPQDPSNTAEVQLDNILDEFDTAFQGPSGPGFKQTLGGLVTNSWIEGDLAIDTPVLVPQAVIWIPISVLVGV